MGIKDISPDDVVFWRSGFVVINMTIVYTWVVMAILVFSAWLATRRLSTGPDVSRLQNFLEVVVSGIQNQIREISQRSPEPYTPFVGTLFLFIAVSNLLSLIPGFEPPTASLSTTAALALCVLVAVPLYGIANQGLWGYLKLYAQPTLFMLPFNVIGELSRTLALAVRLFGNMMSGSKIAAILLAVAPLFFPVVMQLLGLLTGLIQAYIFAILAMVYIASSLEAHDRVEHKEKTSDGETSHG